LFRKKSYDRNMMVVICTKIHFCLLLITLWSCATSNWKKP